MRYIAVRTEVVDPDMLSAEWERANVGYIGVDRWKEYSISPVTSFRMLRGPEGISVLMHSEEQGLRCECREENGDVYLDSCMEFFFKPDVHDNRYFNFELNSKGVLHLGLGDGRHGRTLIGISRDIFNIETRVEEGNWSVKLYIPYSFILSHFSKISPVCKGNFYKGGEGTDHVHFGAWSEVETDRPDFHVPDFFGRIELEK